MILPSEQIRAKQENNKSNEKRETNLRIYNYVHIDTVHQEVNC